MYSSYNSLYTSFLYHSGVKGMKWGIRRKAAKETRHLKTKNGLDVDLVRKDPSIIARALIGAAAGAVMSIGYNKVMGNI